MNTKIVILVATLLLGGCAANRIDDRYAAETTAHENTMLGNLSLPLTEFWGRHAEIAEKYGKYRERKVFLMLQFEAEKMQRGESNSYKELVDRYVAHDQTLFASADGYFLALTASRECSGFGYAKSSPEFNKCVFDVKTKLFSMQLQQEQIISQMMMATRPAPLRLPTQTRCTSSGNQTTCSTQ